MMKHAHRVSNLAKEDVDLVGRINQTWSPFYGRVMLITFEIACKSIYSFGETSEWESFFLRYCFLYLISCLRSNIGEE